MSKERELGAIKKSIYLDECLWNGRKSQMKHKHHNGDPFTLEQINPDMPLIINVQLITQS